MTDGLAGAGAVAWSGRAAGFLAGGAVGAWLVGLVLGRLPDVHSPLGPLVVGTAVTAAGVGLVLWRLAVRPPRVGPTWGGLVAAWIPALLTAALAAAALAVGDLGARQIATAAAVLYLAATPLTAVLAVVGVALERRWPRVGHG